jgi:ABC-type branched-subunit amino acid transport system substrate-binding protein
VTTISFDSTARAVANSGADYVFGLLEEGTSASLARSLAQINYELKAEEYPVAYGSNFVKLAGPAGNGASSWIDVLPVEDGGQNPEQAQFIKWMKATAPNSRTDVFAELAWAASKAFLDSLEALPGPITREAVLAQMRNNHDYNAGGLLGSIDLGRQANRGCLVAVQLDGGTWKRLLPEAGFQC